MKIPFPSPLASRLSAAVVALSLVLAISAGCTSPGPTETQMSAPGGGPVGIYGVLTVPADSPERPPVVIICHGLGSQGDNFALEATLLAEAGIASYRFDFVGGSADSKSGTDTTDMSVLTEKSEADAVIDFVRSQPTIDPERVYLFGESQGGLVSLMAAADRPKDLAGLFLLYPALNIPSMAEERFADLVKISDSVELMGVQVGERYFTDALTVDTEELMRALPLDVVLFHGGNDPFVEVSVSQQAQETLPSAELIIYRGEGHGFSEPIREEVIAEIIARIVKVK